MILFEQYHTDHALTVIYKIGYEIYEHRFIAVLPFVSLPGYILVGTPRPPDSVESDHPSQHYSRGVFPWTFLRHGDIKTTNT